jgi:Alw26I/Eco31I/Esp3I family type II restriction m6 adenine DNA methyltransferase
MPSIKQCSLIDRYNVIVSDLAKRKLNGDMTAARMSADDALTGIALNKLGIKTDRPEIGPDYQSSIASIIDSAENVRDAVNEILNASCAIVRETAARDAGVVYTPSTVARYMSARAIGNNLLGKFESGLPAKPDSIDDLIDGSERQTLERLKDELEHIRLIDTSCGTGIFLESALEELCRLKSAISRRLGDKPTPWHVHARDMLANNIFGLDIEAYSVKSARTRLLLRMATAGLDVDGIKMNLGQGNALLHDNNGLLSGDFDVIVGNPPYMRVKSMFRTPGTTDSKRKKQDFAQEIRSSGLYHCQEGNLNLYKLFVERNLSLLRKQGSMCLIFPSSFLNETTSEPLRKQIFSNYAVEEIIEIPERSRLFGGVNQATCIFTCRKGAPLNELKVKPGAGIDSLESCPAITIDLNELNAMTLGRMEVPLLRSPDIEWALLQSLRRIPPFRGNGRFPPIGEISVGNVDETIDKEFISHTTTGDIFVKGIHLSEYVVDLRPDGPGPRWVRKEAFLEKRPAVGRVIAHPRIIGRNTRNKASSRRLKFALLPEGYVCGNSIKQIIVTDRDIDPLYLMALLNSSVLNWYFEVFCSQNNIRNYCIEALPIPRASQQAQDAFAFVARLIMESSGDVREFLDKKIMDAMAYELYFMDMRMLSSAILSSMEDGATAETFKREEDIAAIVDRITSREGFRVIQSATYRK